MTYLVRLDTAAARDLDRLERVMWVRVHRELDLLASNPRPIGCVKLKGIANSWRVRIGDFRIVYEIDDRVRIVTINRVVNRKNAYR